MKRFLWAAMLLLLFNPASSIAQDPGFSFDVILTPGDSLRQVGDMMGAIDAYKKSIASGYIYAADDKSFERSSYFADTYNLACALSRAGQPDSAVKYMRLFTTESHDSVGEALTDPDLINMRKGVGWPELENIIIKNYCSKAGVQLKDIDYAKKLWRMRAIDQAYYKDIEIAEQKTGKTSSVVLALWDLKQKLNEENQRQLEQLIKEKGWPKLSSVGATPAITAFLVVQHSSLAQQQKYLPVIKNLCKVGEARWQDYALMYDRIQANLGKPQLYGSQVKYNLQAQKYELFELEDATKVDEWRKEAGLQPLSEYLKNYKIAWPQ